MIEGSLESSPASLSAGGHDEQPWLVNSSTTARGSACSGPAVNAAATTASDNATRALIPISTSSTRRLTGVSEGLFAPQPAPRAATRQTADVSSPRTSHNDNAVHRPLNSQ